MVELESVSFHYGREDAGMLLTGVEDISFKIEKGQCAVLLSRFQCLLQGNDHAISALPAKMHPQLILNASAGIGRKPRLAGGVKGIHGLHQPNGSN